MADAAWRPGPVRKGLVNCVESPASDDIVITPECDDERELDTPNVGGQPQTERGLPVRQIGVRRFIFESAVIERLTFIEHTTGHTFFIEQF